jgi:hypothetical protein
LPLSSATKTRPVSGSKESASPSLTPSSFIVFISLKFSISPSFLKDTLYLYFDLGYNGEKYYKYYLQGKLDRKLDKYYNDTGIEIAKEYLEEKGPQFVKRK